MHITKFKKYNIFSLLVMLVNPYLSLFVLFHGIQQKNWFSVNLFIVVVSLVTYQLAPFNTMDLAMHYKFYDEFTKMNIKQFMLFLIFKSDYLFYVILFVAARIGITGQLIMALFTFFTLKIFYDVMRKWENKYSLSKKDFLIIIILFFISLEFIGLFSGIRNMFGVSVAFLGIYKGIESQKLLGGFLILISGFIHFSLFALVPIYLLIIFPIRYNLAKLIFLFSFLFLFFLQKEVLYNILLSLSFPDAINIKIEAYLVGDDMVQIGIKSSKSAQISYFIRNLWMWFAFAYLLITNKYKSKIRYIVLIYFTFLNIVSAAPDLFLRYTYLGKPLFLLMLIYELHIFKNKKAIKVFTIVFALSFIVNLIILRDFFINSLINNSGLSTITILMKQLDLSQFFHAS